MGMRSRELWRWLVQWCVATASLFLISLAIYSREYTGWVSPGEYDVDVTHSALGVPHWLVINQIKIDGTPPPIDSRYLPEGDLYQPGWHVRPLQLALSLQVCFGIGLLGTWGFARLSSTTSSRIYAIPLISAALTAPLNVAAWIDAVLVLIVLPSILVAASAIGRNYWISASTGLATVVVLWAGARLRDLFRDQHLVHGLPTLEDLLLFTVIAGCVVLIALLATFLGRRFTRSTGG